MPNKNTDHPFYPLEEETIPNTTLNVTPITDDYESGKQIANSLINNPNKEELIKLAFDPETEFATFKAIEFLMRKNNDWVQKNFSDLIFKPVANGQNDYTYEMGPGGHFLRKIIFGRGFTGCEDFVLRTLEELTNIKNSSQLVLVKDILAAHCLRSLNAEIHGQANEKTRGVGKLMMRLNLSRDDQKRFLGESITQLTYKYFTVIPEHIGLLSKAIEELEQKSISPVETSFPRYFLKRASNQMVILPKKEMF